MSGAVAVGVVSNVDFPMHQPEIASVFIRQPDGLGGVESALPRIGIGGRDTLVESGVGLSSSSLRAALEVVGSLFKSCRLVSRHLLVCD